MFGDGKTFYHPVYIGNLCDSFWAAFESDKKSGETYLIGDERYVSLNELVTKVGESLNLKVKILKLPFTPIYALSALVEFICKPLRIPPPLFRRRADWYRKNRAFKIDKAKKDKDIGEDEAKRLSAQVEEVMNKTKSDVEAASKAKEQEIMTV